MNQIANAVFWYVGDIQLEDTMKTCRLDLSGIGLGDFGDRAIGRLLASAPFRSAAYNPLGPVTLSRSSAFFPEYRRRFSRAAQKIAEWNPPQQTRCDAAARYSCSVALTLSAPRSGPPTFSNVAGENTKFCDNRQTILDLETTGNGPGCVYVGL